jgi:hypothetical protein
VTTARLGAVAACLACVTLGACGGGHGKTARAGQRTSGGEEAEREAALARLAPDDRVAYYQLATTTGILRAQAALAQRGHPAVGATSDTALLAGRARLATLRPRDANLGRLRGTLAAAVDAFLRAGGAKARRAAAGPALSAAARVDADLRRYLERHRAQALLIPE